jgi:hypothetical protein
MKSRFVAAFLLALPLVAQDDSVALISGSKVDGVKVISFDIRELKYSKGGSTQSVPTDQVSKVSLARFNDVFRLGLKDPDLMLTKAREQLEEKNPLMAQFGFISAANQFLDQNKASEGVGALDELKKALPEAGTIPDYYRLKFEYYMGLGQSGASNALQLAKKYQTEATGSAWPSGLATEAEFFIAMAEGAAGGNPKDFQNKLRTVATKASGTNVMIANRANIQLANSLRETKEVEPARKIYEDLAKRDGVDSVSRAGALLGLGAIALDEAGSDKDAARRALLLFLRVRLETRDAWPSQHAEAMYYAIKAADKWRGTDYQYVMARCRGVLFNDFGGSEWANKARAGH